MTLGKISQSRDGVISSAFWMRTKSNNKRWRVVFRLMHKENASLECTKRLKAINNIYFIIFRLMPPALSTSVTSILFKTWPLQIMAFL